MRRDLLGLSGATIALGFIGWALWGNPGGSPVPRMHTVQSLNPDPNVWFVSKGSPYMRDER
jgi:hypothetical protein